MEKSMEILLAKLDEKLDQQTKLITTTVTQNVMAALDEKFKAITEENTQLKNKISELELKLKFADKDKRKNNLVFFGIEEGKATTETELVDYIKDIILEMGVHFEAFEINNTYRIGKKELDKNRPVVVSLTTTWKKHMILRNRRNLQEGINIKEDYPKEIIEKRKQLQRQVEEEKNKGNIAFIKYDKLIIKKTHESNREKRKRETSRSPKTPSQKKVNASNTQSTSTTLNNASSKTTTKETMRPNILSYIERGRSASLSNPSKN